jgi:hypothetical protein
VANGESVMIGHDQNGPVLQLGQFLYVEASVTVEDAE